MTLWGALVGIIVGGVAMLLLSRILFGRFLRDRSATGGAWVRGRRGDFFLGLGVGILSALAFGALVAVFRALGANPTPGPLARMATTPGISQVVWLVMALLLAPPIEECLFRGVVYGGYRRSFGATAALALTTAIFVLKHLRDIIGFPPAAIGIGGMAVAAAWMRLRSSAIGPAVAVHFGYNLIIAVGAVLITSRQG